MEGKCNVRSYICMPQALFSMFIKNKYTLYNIYNCSTDGGAWKRAPWWTFEVLQRISPQSVEAVFVHGAQLGCSPRETRTWPAHSPANHALHFAWQININEDYHITAVHPEENKAAPPLGSIFVSLLTVFKKKNTSFHCTFLSCFLTILIILGIDVQACLHTHYE